MTAITPMMSPSAVSSVRTRFAESTAIASATYCVILIAARSRAERYDRVHARGTDRGIGSEDAADHRRETDRDRDDQQVWDRCGPDELLDRRVRQHRHREAEQRADPAAEEREQDRFEQELQQHVAAAGPDRLAQADLARALGDRDQHDVHDPDPRDHERDSADRGEADRDDAEHGVEALDLALVVGGDVLCARPVQPLQHRVDLGGDPVERDAGVGVDRQRVDRARDDLVERRVRHEQDLVAVDRVEQAALDLFVDADDRAARPPDLDGTADGRPRLEELVGELRGHHAHVRTGRHVGGTVEVGGTRCTIVGVYEEIKGGLFNSIGGNEILFMPYTTFHEIVPGPIDSLTIYANPGVTLDRITTEIDAVLQRLHGPRAQYITTDNQGQIQGFNTVLGIIAIGLTSIGGVALVVAGIGIMNIMLVSVTERTREIGLRKAIGARRGDVLLQFLLEAILLSFFGGGIGTLFGFAVTVLAYSSVEKLVGPAPIPYLLIIAVGFSAMVGCIFGTYPAIRAARMDPIVALRS